MTTTKVQVLGPNLRDSNETFHIHAVGCADIARNYGRGKRWGGDRLDNFVVTVDAGEDVAFAASREVYSDIISDYGWTEADNPVEAAEYFESNASDFRVFPCVK